MPVVTRTLYPLTGRFRVRLAGTSAIVEKETAPTISIKPLTPRNLDHVVRRGEKVAQFPQFESISFEFR